MGRTTTLTVRLSGPLSDFIGQNVGDSGSYENVSEYVRDLIRRDKYRVEAIAFERLKAELQKSFSEPASSYISLTAEDVIARGKSR